LFLSILSIYQKDLIQYQTGNKQQIVFQDDIDTISEIVTHKSKNRLIEELEHMLTLKSRMYNYINERLAYDNLLLELERR
jgi:DNA polymerase-3 subunit delta'